MTHDEAIGWTTICQPIDLYVAGDQSFTYTHKFMPAVRSSFVVILLAAQSTHCSLSRWFTLDGEVPARSGVACLILAYTRLHKHC